MNQIPNIEETKDFPELEKQYVAMWEKGEFEWNHHEGDELGKKPISPWRIWTTFIKPTLHQQLQKAREQRKGWKGYVAVDPKADNYKYSPVFSDRKGAELWVKGKEISGLEVVEVDILLADHSELDQDKK